MRRFEMGPEVDKSNRWSEKSCTQLVANPELFKSTCPRSRCCRQPREISFLTNVLVVSKKIFHRLKFLNQQNLETELKETQNVLTGRN